jgi:hypothetical protein
MGAGVKEKDRGVAGNGLAAALRAAIKRLFSIV